MRNKGVCRTATAQPGLLIKVKVLIQSGCILSCGEVGIESVCATMRLFYSKNMNLIGKLEANQQKFGPDGRRLQENLVTLKYIPGVSP